MCCAQSGVCFYCALPVLSTFHFVQSSLLHGKFAPNLRFCAESVRNLVSTYSSLSASVYSLPAFSSPQHSFVPSSAGALHKTSGSWVRVVLRFITVKDRGSLVLLVES